MFNFMCCKLYVLFCCFSVFILIVCDMWFKFCDMVLLILVMLDYVYNISCFVSEFNFVVILCSVCF